MCRLINDGVTNIATNITGFIIVAFITVFITVTTVFIAVFITVFKDNMSDFKREKRQMSSLDDIKGWKSIYLGEIPIIDYFIHGIHSHESPLDCKLMKLRKKARQKTDEFNQKIIDFKINYMEFITLWYCTILDEITINKVREKLGIDQRNIRDWLQKLEKLELLQIEENKHRYFVWHVTQRGYEEFTILFGIWREFNESL